LWLTKIISFFFAFAKKTATKVNRKLCQRRGTRGKKKKAKIKDGGFGGKDGRN